MKRWTDEIRTGMQRGSYTDWLDQSLAQVKTKVKAAQPSQPTPSQINRQDTAQIREQTRPITPTQINRQDTAQIEAQTGKKWNEVKLETPSAPAGQPTFTHAQRTARRDDEATRDYFAQAHPEYTDGLEGTRTRAANTAVILGQFQVDKARAKVDDAQQKWDEVKLERPSAPASTYLTGGVPTTPSLPYAAAKQYDPKQARESALARVLQQAKSELYDAQKDLGYTQTQKADLDRERELLEEVSTPAWSQRIRDQYATPDQYGRISDEEVRAQKIKAKKGIVQAERDRVKSAMDAAQGILFAEQDNAGDYWDPTHPSKRYAAAWRDYQSAKERLDELDGELNELANLDYPARNESAFGRLAVDPKAAGQYVSATKIKEDQQKLNEVIGYYMGGGSGGDQEEYERISQMADDLYQDYGLGLDAISAYAMGYDTPPSGGVSVSQVMARMETLLSARAKALAETDGKKTGYDFEDLYGYEQRFQKQQEAAKQAEETARLAREHPVISTAATIGAQFFVPFDLLNFDPGKGKPGDVGYIPPDTSGMAAANYIQTVRGTISSDLERDTDWELWGQNIPAFLYNVGMSTADSATAISVLGPGSIYLMGTNAAVSTAKDVVDSGGTTDQALKLGIAAGAAEVLFEKFSVENLLKPRTVSGWRGLLTQYVLGQGGVELTDEALTEASNILAEMSILGQSSDYAKAVAGYRRQGQSESQAEQQAFLDMLGRVTWSGIGGGISGMAMGSGKAAVDYAGRGLDVSLYAYYSDLNGDGVTSADHGSGTTTISAQQEDLERLAKRYGVAYTDTERYTLLARYQKSIAEGWLSPLVDFTLYEDYHQKIQERIIGRVVGGVEIKGQARHFMERLFGCMEDPQTKRSRSGVALEDIFDCMENPVRIKPIMIDKHGRPSFQVEGRRARISINPDDGTLIQVNPWRRKENG